MLQPWPGGLGPARGFVLHVPVRPGGLRPGQQPQRRRRPVHNSINQQHKGAEHGEPRAGVQGQCPAGGRRECRRARLGRLFAVHTESLSVRGVPIIRHGLAPDGSGLLSVGTSRKNPPRGGSRRCPVSKLFHYNASARKKQEVFVNFSGKYSTVCNNGSGCAGDCSESGRRRQPTPALSAKRDVRSRNIKKYVVQYEGS